MPKPSIEFRYSAIYDEQWRFVWNQNKENDKNAYPNPLEIFKFSKKLQKEWRKKEQDIFVAIAKITGISWQEKNHICYIVGKASPFSDPFTMPVFGEKAPIDYAADVVTHELIHRNLIQLNGSKIATKGLARLKKNFFKDNENVRVHIIVHAIHELVFRKVFNAERLEREQRIMKDYEDYRRAWEIVNSESAGKILKLFFDK